MDQLQADTNSEPRINIPELSESHSNLPENGRSKTFPFECSLGCTSHPTSLQIPSIFPSFGYFFSLASSLCIRGRLKHEMLYFILDKTPIPSNDSTQFFSAVLCCAVLLRIMYTWKRTRNKTEWTSHRRREEHFNDFFHFLFLALDSKEDTFAWVCVVTWWSPWQRINKDSHKSEW